MWDALFKKDAQRTLFTCGEKKELKDECRFFFENMILSN